MDDHNGYAVFFFPKALEALGEAIKPYLGEGTAGAHVVCRGVDTGGSLVKMILDGRTSAGALTELELMVPGSMVRMIVSTRTEEAFGFGPRIAVPATEAGQAAAEVPGPGETAEAAADQKTAVSPASASSREAVEEGPKTPV